MFGIAAYTGVVESSEFVRHGYDSKARLAIEPARGRYLVTLYPLAFGGGIPETMSCQPEDEAQQQEMVNLAMVRPVDAILYVIGMAAAWRREKEEH